jgi:hypothetical protein
MQFRQQTNFAAADVVDDVVLFAIFAYCDFDDYTFVKTAYSHEPAELCV